MNVTTTTARFSYRIQPKPDGGFVATPSDPAMETLEGSTREEVEHKIQAKTSEVIEAELPTSLGIKLGGISVSVKPKVTFNIKTKSSGADASESPTLSQNSAPIVSFDNSGRALRVIAALIGVAALVIYFLLRR